ncbi:MAG: hypothetical protein BWK76_08215 [Desulfobulbaceae bacterium A2]|nr:MAG: hypothetical protein BWK76_08215 [Desulfobulbaceae bacterium A2]
MTATPQWQIERGQLNHNWLQNGVVVALNHAAGICSGTVRPRDTVRSLSEDINRWQERSAELSSLLDRFEDEMSPKIYFDFPPLSRCPANTRSWLEPLTHELWLQRGMREKIDAAKSAYQKADRAFYRIYTVLDKLPTSPTMVDLKPICSQLHSVINRCQALADLVSALPHRILFC